jgi:hypothetical protein
MRSRGENPIESYSGGKLGKVTWPVVLLRLMDPHQARTGDKFLWVAMAGQQGHATIRVNLRFSRVFHWRDFGHSSRSGC